MPKKGTQKGKRDEARRAEMLARMEIISAMKMPSFAIDAGKTWHPGDRFALKVKGCLFPVADLATGRLLYPRKLKPGQVLVSFNGTHGPAIARADFDPGQKTLRGVVPEAARSGPLVVLMPMTELGGDLSELKSGAPAKNATREARIIAIPVITTPIRVTCEKCRDPEESLCPYGNIRFDADGYCYVNQDSCRGRSHDGTICWECFPQGATGPSSTLCTFSVLRKTAYISRVGDDWCCGCCDPSFQLIPGFCIKDLCAYDAVTGGNSLCDRCPRQSGGLSPNEVDDWGYWIDKDVCNGCEACFENISCPKVHMKAFIGMAQISVEIKTLHLKLLFRRIPPDAIKERLRLGIWQVKNHKFQLTELPISYSSKAQRLEFKLSSGRAPHVAVFAREKGGPAIPLGFDARATIRALGEGSHPRSEIIRLNTILGPCDLTLEYSPVRPPAKKSRAKADNDGICEELRRA